jgi:hypothetical protein
MIIAKEPIEDIVIKLTYDIGRTKSPYINLIESDLLESKIKASGCIEKDKVRQIT